MKILSHPTLPILVTEDGEVGFFYESHNQHKSWIKFRGFTRGHKDNKGYMSVKFNKKNLAVHRLVAETFIPNPENKPTVDHINRVRDDNRVENLRWATHTEQRENSSIVLDRKDYGVRECKDRTAYQRVYSRDYYKRNPEKCRSYALTWYHKNKDKINEKRRKCKDES